MEEIKFRVLNKKNNKIYPVSGIIWADKLYAPTIVIFVKGSYIPLAFDDCFLMPCIGHDKNFKDVYLGDIFEFEDVIWHTHYTESGRDDDFYDVINHAVVGFDDCDKMFGLSKFQYDSGQLEFDLNSDEIIDLDSFMKTHEVVGNIYENPELLETPHEPLP